MHLRMVTQRIPAPRDKQVSFPGAHRNFIVAIEAERNLEMGLGRHCLWVLLPLTDSKQNLAEAVQAPPAAIALNCCSIGANIDAIMSRTGGVVVASVPPLIGGWGAYSPCSTSASA